MDTVERQILREKNSLHQAQARSTTKLVEACANGQIDQIPQAGFVIARLYSLVSSALQALHESNPRGSAKGVLDWIKAVDVDVLAVLSIRTVLQQILKHGNTATVQRVTHSLGRAVVREVLIRQAEKVNPVYIQRTWTYLDGACTKSQQHINRTMDTVIQNILEEDTPDLCNSDYIHIGKHCLQACMDAGLVELTRRYNKGKTYAEYELNSEVLDALTTMNPAMVRPAAQAMICPPIPWVDTRNGGYISYETRRRNPLISASGLTQRQSTMYTRTGLLNDAVQPLSILNYLQSIPFRVHQPTFDMLRGLWEAGGGSLGVPSRVARGKPESPFPEPLVKADITEEQAERLSAWKRQTRAWYTEEKLRIAGVLEVADILKSNAKLAGNPVWYPMFFDFRGRMYYRGSPNPQGADHSKSMVHFDKKKPLGDRGEFWLKVHIANCFGHDKTRMAARVRWTDENLEQLRSALSNPSGEVFAGADKPFAAFSAVYELDAAIRSGNVRAYETGIPVHMDATCSGLQHFSAMLRDPVGGMYTNLLDDGQAQKYDIYAKVAELVIEQLRRIARGRDEKALMAQVWEKVGVSRKLAKKPTMTYVYGVTMRGVSDYCCDYLRDQGVDPDLPLHKLANFMAGLMFNAIAGVVPAAAECMNWLRHLMTLVDSGEPVIWYNPIGFPVVQEYLKTTDKKVRIRSCGLTQIVVRENTDENKLKRMSNGVVPNFIHSMDAAHLGLVARGMATAGLDTVAVHDSIGSHPCDIDILHSIIRQEFVGMYQDTNYLKNLTKGLDLEVKLPDCGRLDLQRVLSSEFFFG